MKIPVKVYLPGCIQQRSDHVVQVANSFPSGIRAQLNTKAHTHIWRRTSWLTKKSFNSLQSFYLAMFLFCAAYFGRLWSKAIVVNGKIRSGERLDSRFVQADIWNISSSYHVCLSRSESDRFTRAVSCSVHTYSSLSFIIPKPSVCCAKQTI